MVSRTQLRGCTVSARGRLAEPPRLRTNVTEASDEKLRCARCGDVIGVYEPAVIVVDGVAHAASLATAPDKLLDGAHVYHRACSLDAVPDP